MPNDSSNRSPQDRLRPAALAMLLAGTMAAPVPALADCGALRPMEAWEIREELGGHELNGYSMRTDARWSERLHADGSSEFVNSEGKVTNGRWRLSGSSICFSYGTLTEWSCKYVERAPSSCRDFRYALMNDDGRMISAIYEARQLTAGRDDGHGDRYSDAGDRRGGTALEDLYGAVPGGGERREGRREERRRDESPRDEGRRGDGRKAGSDYPDPGLPGMSGGDRRRADENPFEDGGKGPRDRRRTDQDPRGSDPDRRRADADPFRGDGGRRRNEPEGELAATGTGFVVDKNGAILTNAHVVRECRYVTIGDGTPAEVIGVDDEVDLAVIRSGGTTWQSIATFADGPARLNSDVTVIGYPLHGILGGINVTRGAVSALTGLGGRVSEFQITAAVQPGNSGGPVLDANGAVVGVVRSKLNAKKYADMTGDIPQNVNFAIRGENAKVFLVRYGVFYTVNNGTEKPAPADLADAAQAFTVLINCMQ